MDLRIEILDSHFRGNDGLEGGNDGCWRMGYGGGTFVKVPPHPLKTFGFGGWLRAGILDSSAIASE